MSLMPLGGAIAFNFTYPGFPSQTLKPLPKLRFLLM